MIPGAFLFAVAVGMLVFLNGVMRVTRRWQWPQIVVGAALAFGGVVGLTVHILG